MRQILSIAIIPLLVFFSSCDSTTGSAQTGSGRQTLSVDQFEAMLNQTKGAQLVDVRTADEFADAHLKNAVNLNVNREDYKDLFNTLDKSRPVLVYCLSGGRSGRAAKIMEEMGFKQVYNMDGGILKWMHAGKEVERAGGTLHRTGMTSAQLNQLAGSKNYVLVDYNATWCAPCKKMLPVLESLAERKKDKLSLVKIDADQNKDLLNEKGVSSVPYLELYHEGRLVWKHEGYIEEQELLDETKL